MSRFVKLAMATAIALSLTVGAFAQKAPAKYPTKPMDFSAPAGAGGGWDTTIRMVAKALQDEKIVSVAMPVTNRPGGGGAVNLAYMQGLKGSDQFIAVYSPPLMLNQITGTSNGLGWKDTTPIARLITDFGGFYVAKNSKYKTLADVIAALKKDPKSVKLGGTSGAGSMDHVQFLIVAKAAGIKDLRSIQYIAFQDNSGPSQLMGNHIDVFSGGIGELRGLVESGDLVNIGITAPERLTAPIVKDYKTCKEQGYDVTFYNWRGLFGAPGMPEYALNYWRDALAKMAKTPTWATILQNQAWAPAYLDTADFKKFLEQNEKDFRDVLTELGMAK